MRDFDITTHKVGDEVAVLHSGGFGAHWYDFTSITHITPTGIFRVAFRPATQIGPDGYERGNRYHGIRVVALTQEVRDYQAAKDARDPVYRFLRDLTRQQLDAATTEHLTTAATALGWVAEMPEEP